MQVNAGSDRLKVSSFKKIVKVVPAIGSLESRSVVRKMIVNCLSDQDPSTLTYFHPPISAIPSRRCHQL
jgi:hypothetical protein